MTEHATPTLLIHGGTVIDGLGNPPFRADVLLAGDRIATIGPDLAASAAPDLPRLDASGLTVMPGLIDAHCHISFDEPNSNDELFFHRREGLAAIIAAANVSKLLAAGVTGFWHGLTAGRALSQCRVRGTVTESRHARAGAGDEKPPRERNAHLVERQVLLKGHGAVQLLVCSVEGTS